MPDLLSILEFLIELKLGPILSITLFTPILAGLSFVSIPCLRHARRRWRTALFFLLLWIAGCVADLYGWYIPVIIGFVLLLVGYSLLAWRSVDKPIGFSRYILHKQEQRMEQCVYEQTDDANLERCPLLLRNFADRLAWSALRNRYLMQMERYKDAYVFLNQMPMDNLFLNELDVIHMGQAYCLYHLGDVNKARMLLDGVSNHDISWLQLDSLLWESRGNLTKAFESLEQAKNKLVANHKLCASIYNNFGRLRRLQSNNTEASYYYRLAVDHVLQDNDKLSMHVAYQNLIQVSAMTEGASELTKRLLDEYRGQLDLSRRLDRLEWGNFEIQYARQTHAEAELPALVERTYFKLIQNASPRQRSGLQISTLRIVRNAQMNPEFLMKDIRVDFVNYLGQPMPERFYLFKELSIYFRTLSRISTQDYNAVFLKVKEYIEQQAIQDIDGYLLSLEPWQVHERAKLLQEMVGIFKDGQRPYVFSKVQRILQDVADLYEKSGLCIEKIDTLLNLADECLFYKNLDENHMTCYFGEMRSAMQRAEEEMGLISSHPNLAAFHLRLGYYELFLQNGDRTLSHLLSFETQNISILHFDEWLRSYYAILKRYESREVSSIQELFAPI
jgi:hypothetical protein